MKSCLRIILAKPEFGYDFQNMTCGETWVRLGHVLRNDCYFSPLISTFYEPRYHLHGVWCRVYFLVYLSVIKRVLDYLIEDSDLVLLIDRTM